MFSRSVVLVVSLVAALACYLINFQTGAVIALIVGILFELAFGFNLVGLDKSATRNSLDTDKKL